MDNNIQQQVWKHYRPGQEKDKQPSLHYVATALAAIFAVADQEGVKYDAHEMIKSAGVKLAMIRDLGVEVENAS